MSIPTPHILAVEPPIPRHRDWRALIPLVAGLYWLALGGQGWWLLWGAVPGLLMAGTGSSQLLWPGDSRISSYMALGGVVGLVCAIPAIFVGNFGHAAIAALLSVATFLLAGRISIGNMARVIGTPPPETGMSMNAKSAIDEALLGYFVITAQLPEGEVVEAMCTDAIELLEKLETCGALADPSILHKTPTAPSDVRIDSIKVFGQVCERVRYPSGFVADARLPGAAVWDNHPNNSTMNSLVLRHEGRSRPWLLCIHGYRMGVPMLDLGLFAPKWLHHSLGLNLMLPTLPLHGSRRIGRLSGDQYLDGDLLDLLHAQSQALWDLRRAVAWIRSQDPEARIGVLGFSLGGFNTALLSTYQEGLDFVVAGIPLVDIASALWRVMPAAYGAYLDRRNVSVDHYRQLLSPVSPLSRPPLLDVSRRAIFAGLVDRVVEPEHPMRLSAHWGVPVGWYHGGHLTFRGEPIVSRSLRDMMAAAGWSDRDSGPEVAVPPHAASPEVS